MWHKVINGYVMAEILPPDSQDGIIVFGAKKIRRAWLNGESFFSVVDIIAALTGSDNPRNYWNMMKARVLKESGFQLSTLCVQLKLTSSDGKTYGTDCISREAAIGQRMPQDFSCLQFVDN